MKTELEVLVTTRSCEGSDCPTVYRKDEETFVIQGYVADGLFSEALPNGEQAVTVPATLIEDLVATLAK